MTLQVLISTVDQKDFSLLEKMNIQSDAVVVNQCDKNMVEDFVFRGHRIKWISMSGRGVGLSRNSALAYADADIVLWADDDMVYFEGYREKVLRAFQENPKADIICFNLNIYQGNILIDGNYHTKKKRLSLINCMRYGAPAVSARRKVILKNNLSFSLLFGGGAEFSSGEDSLFLCDCVKKKLYLLADPEVLANVYNQDSTWFCGYTDKFFTDKGVFYCVAFPHLYYILFMYYAIRFPRIYKTSNSRLIFKLFVKGRRLIRSYR